MGSRVSFLCMDEVGKLQEVKDKLICDIHKILAQLQNIQNTGFILGSGGERGHLSSSSKLFAPSWVVKVYTH